MSSSVATCRNADTADFDVERIRADFPILHQKVHGRPLVYLDNAATTHKPRAVIEAVSHYYERDNSNIHRGVHTLSERATAAYESARRTVARFLRARSEREIVFVRGTTEGINLVAQSFGRTYLKPGDEILITAMEHHSNIVPWQLLCQQTGTVLRVAPIDERGEVIVEEFQRLLTERVKLVSVVHISNALGTLNPIETMIRMAHEQGARVLIDAAQSVAHTPVDVQALDCDFLVFSGHKIYGPTGIGALYARAELLEAMPPYQGGGDMIRRVSFEKTEYNEIPYKFEAGTPHIAGGIGLGAALDYVSGIGLESIAHHEHEILAYATRRAEAVQGLRIIGTAREKASILSFTLDRVHPHDIGTVLDHCGIAIRAGHHCAMPVMDFYGVPATARASFGLYNTAAEVDALITAIAQTIEVFG